MSDSSTKREPGIEEAIVELEGILESLEDGATTLEEGLARYERGVSLLKTCYETLSKAELRIRKVTGTEDGVLNLETFVHAPSSDAREEARETKPPVRSRKKAVEPDPDIPF